MAKQIIVIGAGAAGCMAAVFAARGGASVTILEKNQKAGKKLLSTGNGRCNFTNLSITPEAYHTTADDPFFKAVISELSSKECIGLFKELGITPIEKSGMIYPYSEQAKAVRSVLLRELDRLKVKIECEADVTEVKLLPDGGFVVKADGEYKADAIILTTGGLAAPKSGSDGSGLDIAKSLGHTVTETYPALTYLVSNDGFFKRASGDRIYAAASLFVENKCVSSDTGQIQLTKSGLSGIPIFNVSRYAAPAIAKNRKVTVALRLVPDLSDDELKDELSRRMSLFDVSVYDAFVGLLPERFTDAFLRYLGIDCDIKTQALSRDDKERITEGFFKLSFEIKETGGFSDAQVTRGGVALSQIDDKTFGSKHIRGLFFAGEILDMDARCGGYNLHFAWASGKKAGKSAAEYVR